MTPHKLPEILFHDERIVVVNKPTGLLSVPGIGPEKADCVAVRVATTFQGARIVHRLDRDTSGVMVLALDAEAHRQLSIQFQERQVTKTYIAIVAGVVADDTGTVDLPMRKDLDDPPRQIIDQAVRGPDAGHARPPHRPVAPASAAHERTRASDSRR